MKANEYIAKFIKVIDDLDKEGIRVPGLILSHAGFGKTSTVKKYCECLDYNLITLIPSMYSADDILGLQTVEKGKLKRLTPSWFNKLSSQLMETNRRTLLFIDEITTCDPYIQGPLLDLIFNGNLGEEHLPSNVFIIAAGNYSKDLNYTFKMSAPLVNRFVLLNLNKEDFDMQELIYSSEIFYPKNDFSKEEIKEYLKVTKDETLIFDIENFKKWIVNSDEVTFGYTEYSEEPEVGLIGFTSIRSVNNVILFLDKFFDCYNDYIWVRIAGDTLGKSEKREGKLLRFVIQAFIKEFKKVSEEQEEFLTTATDTLSSAVEALKLSEAQKVPNVLLARKTIEVLKNLIENELPQNIHSLSYAQESIIAETFSFFLNSKFFGQELSTEERKSIKNLYKDFNSLLSK